MSLHLAALAVALTAGCGATGVEGTTVVDEGCPVLPMESPCPQRPLPARVLVLNHEGAEIAHTDTNEKGEFRIRLSAGDYVLQGQNLTGGPLPSATPVSVTVKDGRMQVVTISFRLGCSCAINSLTGQVHGALGRTVVHAGLHPTLS